MKTLRTILLPVLTALALVGCATKPPAEKPVHTRGWIGGQFKLAQTARFFVAADSIPALPGHLDPEQHIGIVITQLSSNTPAQHAGLAAGDLILQVNGAPATRLRSFRDVLDRATPGQPLTIRFWREGKVKDCTVTVGRETFRHLGTLALVLPPILEPPDLWPNPDFSLVALGYRRSSYRTELGSGEMTYRRAVNKDFHPVDEDYLIWLAVLRLSQEKIILSQEIVPAQTALAGSP